MKKFLSLALALVMSLSLLTVGAGATEYKDLNDKNEIQYEEAVAVLNKLGIITGYEDGSFKPTGALTRGAAAKIIVSLMIGSEAASNLTVAAAPYKDVPVTNTFASVISYCKTAGYISGYTDGTFRPTAPLTGYAFTKMLLGALGYDGKVEGFTGGGWTMNAAKLGNKAGLFDNFKNGFKGNDGVSREGACLLALNTLKGTEVEYSGNTVNVTGENINVSVGNNKYEFVVNNNSSDGNIYVEGTASGKDKLMQFGEEHFSDLKMVADGTADDDFGRPANEWSYKNVKIGTYAQAADKTYTTGADGDTDADMVKDMGLKDYKVPSSTYTLNGKTTNFKSTTDAGKLAEIANLTGKGVLVEAYQDDNNANTINSFVVIKTQLMQVNAVKSSEVTLKTVDDNQNSDTISFMSVKSVKDDDDAFQTLKGLKANDYVLVTPVWESGTTYTVDSVAIPQTVTGKLTNIATKSGNKAVKAITVAGTSYSMSDMWTSEDGNLTVSTKLSTTTDTTVYLDSYGYAIYVKDVTSTNSSIIIDEIYSSVIDGKIVKNATGWDSNGAAVSINLGTSNYLPTGYTRDDELQGKVFEYKTTTSNNADYQLVDNGDAYTASTSSKAGPLVYKAAAGTNIAAGAPKLTVGKGTTKDIYFDSAVKFIFLTCDYTYSSGTTINGISDVTGVTVHDGVTEVNAVTGCDMYYVLNKDSDKIVAVIIANDNDSANTANLLYVEKVTGYKNNAENKRVALFTAYIDGEKVTDCEYNKESLTDNTFYTYSKNDSTGVYSLTTYNKLGSVDSKKTTTVKTSEEIIGADKSVPAGDILSDTYFKSESYVNGVKDAELNAKNAKVVDLYTDDGVDFVSLKDMRTAINEGTINAKTGKAITGFTVSYVYNASDNAGSGAVSYIFITGDIDGTKGNNAVTYGNDSAVVALTSATTGTVKVNICSDSTNTVNALAKAELEKNGFSNVSVMSGFAYATVNGVNVTFTVTPEILYKVTLTLTNCTAKLGTKTLATGDVVYAGSTGVQLDVTATSGSLKAVTGVDCNISATGLVTAAKDGTLIVECA